MDSSNGIATVIEDGCTGWFDGSWRHCCDAHDVAYYMLDNKFVADWNLAVCVWESGGWLIAPIMFIGVTLFGGIYYRKAIKESSKK